MPEAFKCSKCADLFEGEASLTLGFQLDGEDVEFCEGCEHKFAAWLDGHEVNDLTNYEQEEIE